MSSIAPEQFSNREWLRQNSFEALFEISSLLSIKEEAGREALIRTLEHQDVLSGYVQVVNALIQRAGLYPYIKGPDFLTTSELLNFEFHKVVGLDEIVLHSVQGRIYRALNDGANVILSAPTSFGKSLLIDAMIASGKFSNVVVIVPTIALIDETRRRLSARFSSEYKIITHPSQLPTDKNLYVLTQERFVEFEKMPRPEFFVIDEFYKLSPERGDERTFVLNEVFYKLFKTGSQFFLIGPNVRNITVDEKTLNFRYFGTDFSTVVAEIKFVTDGDETQNAVRICSSLLEPTLIFCKSPNSANKLAKRLIAENVTAPTSSASELADWLRQNYHPEWDLPDFLDAGIAVHHGALPRSIAYHILRKFNEEAIRYLICTSTIIEGVNTSAKNIVVYDKKIGNLKPYDLFTFNNIKGRAGRMFRHFVGHVYVLNDEPQTSLPLVDIPSITQPRSTPESLLIQIERGDLSEQSRERLKHLHAQNILPVAVMRLNSGIDPNSQLKLASALRADISKHHPLLSWTGFPTNSQLYAVCTLIFDNLMDGKGKDGIGSAKQLYKKINNFVKLKALPDLVKAEMEYDKNLSASDALENVLKFLRNWCEFHFPRLLLSLDRIQDAVFTDLGLSSGDYSVFGVKIKRLFMPLSGTVLEEYGLPFQVTMKIESRSSLGETVDEITANLKSTDVNRLTLSRLELEMLNDTLSGL